MVLRGKRVLITAGPTWVAIDKVRVISNTATGKTGILLAKELAKRGAKVTLLMGPIGTAPLVNKIRMLRFNYFDELKSRLLKEIKTGKYDILVHSAAVSDYKPLKIFTKKIRSGIKALKLELIPTEKIINLVRDRFPFLFIVGFKYEFNINKKRLVREAQKVIRRASLNLVVANTLSGSRYRAFLVTDRGTSEMFCTKEMMCLRLIKSLEEQNHG